jgi:hypothetical protein
MAGLAVVHLARRQNGIAPFERFLASWRSHPPGVAHDLVIVFKGFRGSPEEHDALLDRIPHRRLFVEDRGFDITAYFEAVRQLDYLRFCFLNSYSRILDDGWLEKMNRWCEQSDVGLVGATGSCQSIAGGYTREERHLRSLPPATQLWRRVGRETLRRVRLGPLRMKLSAYKFESGKESLTNQVRGFGLRALVVGRDGQAYAPERWHQSNTFWQSRQENLLVADNQTELYMSSDAATRAEFAQYAWGDDARPG